MANIKVAVRIRPVSERELNVTGGEIIVHTDGTELSLTNLKVSSSKAGDSRKRTRRYGFDYCFNSSSIESESHATQEKVYETLGKTALDAIFSGFNACLVAYGQSASGKTYTMMGPKNEPGLTPRLCEGLFLRVSEEEKKFCSYDISISYLEIYNERVRDLLKPSTNSRGLRVREHPRLGPYVQGLTCQSVSTLGSLMSYVEEGTRARKKASTLQNPTSSRSHALLTVSLSLRTDNSATVQENKQQHLPRGAKLHLVDLAGSERAGNSNHGLHRLKEGANINKSLVALGNVISALAERGATGSGPGRRFIPYRDSSLTWLLKDALGGNATTIMLATISPASGSYNETAHTLRFAHRAQSVVNRPVVNEDPVARVIRELRAEISRLTLLLSEKEIDGERGSSCCCRGEKDRAIGLKKFEGGNSKLNLHRRSNSDEGFSSAKCQANEDSIPLRKFGSLRSFDGSEVDLPKENVSCEGVSNLALVDIPTLVAVLIKPEVDESRRTVQIEEISGETIAEDTVDLPDFGDEEENKIVAVINDEEIVNPDSEDSVSSVRKEGSDENVSSNWKKVENREDDSLDEKKSSSLKITSKKFGSSESFDCLKKRETRGGLIRRSYTNLQLVRGDKSKAAKVKRTWSPKGSAPASSKKAESFGEKDSPKRLASKEVSAKTSSPSRGKLQDSESPKRKFSRDSSGSGGPKDEISQTSPSKQLRKSSVSSETSIRTQTPIQRTNRRAKIVAAVTERLYSTKKPGEEAAANIQSPEFRTPDSAEFKLANATRMRLQEISRKMLARRRKTCVETQTDVDSTVRVKDMGSITDDFRVATKEVAMVTDLQENCSSQEYSGSSVTRVKEMATLTENFSRTVRLRDVEVLTDDYGEDMSSTGENSDQQIVNSVERREATCFTESSTNTSMENPKSRSSGSQTLAEDEDSSCTGCKKILQESFQLSTSNCSQERNVICITVPDMLSITIESPNTLESKIAITEKPASGTVDDKLLESRTRDGESQTEDPEKVTGSKISESNAMIEDPSATVTTRSAGCQSDGRTFRIENIFKDPKNETRSVERNAASELPPDLTENVELPNKISLKLTNSVGTSFTPETMERSTEIERSNFIDFKTKEISWLKSRSEDLKLLENPRGNFLPGESSPRFFGPDRVRGSCNKNCSTKSCYRINSSVKNPSETRKVAKIEAEDLKSPLLVAKMIANSGIVEVESNNFSDDSLDPDEENPTKTVSLRLDDSLCPPDVVAHTKKEIYESRVDTEDFENESVPEFPRSSLPPEGETRAYDYESLILGKRIFTPVSQELGERNGTNTPESEDGIINRSNCKKKVSFSNSKPPERSRRSNDDARRPKPIIKNSFLLFNDKNVSEEAGDTPKPLQESSPSENSFSRDDDVSSISGSSETVRSVGLYNSEDESEEGRNRVKREEESEMKRVRFSTFLPNEVEGGGDSGTSDSDDFDEESFCCDIKREVFASYLDAATDFVHNMNVNRANFGRFIGEEKEFDDDYIEYRGRRISLRDDTEEYLKEDTFDVPVDSYRNCLRGIDKLEECISRAVRNDKFIIEKYGLLGSESPATRFGLVDPAEDSNRLGNRLTDNLVGVSSRLVGNSSINDSTRRVKEDSSDMEASIFQQLIESSTPIKRSSASGKPYFRRSTRMSDLSGRTQASYSRLRRRQGPSNLRKDETPPLPEGKKSNFHFTPSQDSPLKAPQCFLLVPDIGNKPPSSSSREYRSDSGTSSSEPVCTSSESIDTSSPSARSKLRYPGSPRAKLLQLVTERRQIVNRSRNPSPS